MVLRRVLALVAVAVLAVATLSAGGAVSAAPPAGPGGPGGAKSAERGVPGGGAAATIASDGPLSQIFLSDDLNCQVAHRDDQEYAFFPSDDEVGACATLVHVGGSTYGPADVPAGEDFVPYVPVSQTGVAGLGTEANPYRVTTSVALGETGIELTQIDSYVVGDEGYRTDVTITNTGGTAVDLVVYRAADCYLAGSDTGYGGVAAAEGAVACRGSFVGVPTSRYIQWRPLTPGSSYLEASYGEVWDVAFAGTTFPNTCRCDEDIDNGAGLSWSLTVGAGDSTTVSHRITISPEGGSSGVDALVEVELPAASTMVDPVTGEVIVAIPSGSVADLPIQAAPECGDGSAPTEVVLLLAGTELPMAETAPGSGVWAVTVPAASVTSGELALELTCPLGDEVLPAGRIVLYDPSGYVTDAETGEPVVGAEVHLHQVPDWSPATVEEPDAPETCETTLTREGDEWSQPAPTELGVRENPFSGLIDPAVNPFLTNDDGYYGWDVAEGCWYVVVEAEGYETLTSPVVGVPPEVTDLDLELVPAAGPGCGEAAPTGPFPDVPADHVFCEDIEWMADEGFAGGFVDGTFRPRLPVSRQGVAAFLYRYAGAPEGEDPSCTAAPFSDVPVDHEFCGEIAWMDAQGYAEGYADGRFRPQSTVSRQSLTAFLYRLFGAPAGDDPQCTSSAFTDVPLGHAFCGEIAWAADAGVVLGFDGGAFRPTAPVTRGSFSAFLHRFSQIAVPT